MAFVREKRAQVWVPDDYDDARPWPVILFLHGAGEGGTDGVAQTTVGVGPAIRKEPARFPAIVVFPQSPPRVPWLGASATKAIAALDDAIAGYNIDVNRQYLTGISMGGYGTWHLATRFPQRFAAIVPICGGAENVAASASRLRNVPTWVFHGDRDNIIPVSESREIVAALEALGAPVRYTEYEGVMHNSWDRAYGDADLMPWLLRHRTANP